MRSPTTVKPVSNIDAHWKASASPQEHLILPDGCVDVLERQGQLWVVGPMTRAKRVSFSADPPRGIRFRAATVREWLGISPEELIDTTIPASDLSSLRTAESLEDIVQLVQGVAGPPRIIQAVHALQRAPNTSIAELARTACLSERHFRRLFLIETGLTPKLFGRIQRLQLMVQKLQSTRAQRTTQVLSLADLAYDIGYTDQSHMSREVKALSGLSPRDFTRWMSDLYKTQAQPQR